MTGSTRLAMEPPARVGTARLDDEGYLHTGRAQRQPDRIVVSYRHGGER
mgnify:CR=1 FL=1